MDIAAQFLKVAVFIYNYRLKPSLKQVPGTFMFDIVISCVGTIDIMHYFRNVGLGGL